MATQSTDQPEREGVKEEGIHLKYDLLGVKLNFNDKVASCRLRMPSVLPHGFATHGEDPTVVLDLISSDEDLRHNLKLMKEIVHPNILHARLVHKNELTKGSGTSSVKTVDHWGLVEPYTGILFEYLNKDLGIPPSLKSDVVLLPHDSLRDIVRQMVDGLEHLMIHGYYHGNFTLKNTCYHQKPNGNITVKLAGLKKKGEKKSVCQKQDLFALGDELDVISTIAKEINKVADTNKSGLRFDTCQIDDLVKKLKLVTEANLSHIYQEIKGQVFFWEVIDRKKIFVYRVAVALKTKAFESRVDRCEDLCILPWNVDDYDGCLQKANKYRVDNKKKPFDGFSRSSFIKFISGLYTHEPKLKEVDPVVMRRHPHLCVLLRNPLGSDDCEWL